MFFPLCGNIVCDIKYKDYFKNTLVHKQISYRAIFKIANFSLRVLLNLVLLYICNISAFVATLVEPAQLLPGNPCFPWCAFLRDSLCLLADGTEQLYIKLAILTTVENRFHFSFLHFVITIWDFRGFYLMQNIRKCPHLWFIWSTFHACLRQKDYLYMDIF